MEMIALFRKRHPELVAHVAPTDAGFVGYKDRRLLSILNKKKLERVLGYLLDENEFLGPHGIRSLSRYHLDHPFTFWVGGQEFKVQYLPAESNTGMFGGNSNWRGPVWMPVNVLIVRALLNLYAFYGDDFKVECPTGSGQHMTLFEVAKEISRRLAAHVPARRQRPAAGLRRHGEVPGRSALARPDPLLRVLPRRQRRRTRGQPPDRVDRPRRAAARPLRAHRRRRTSSRPSGRACRPASCWSRWRESRAGSRRRRRLTQRRGPPAQRCPPRAPLIPEILRISGGGLRASPLPQVGAMPFFPAFSGTSAAARGVAPDVLNGVVAWRPPPPAPGQRAPRPAPPSGSSLHRVPAAVDGGCRASGAHTPRTRVLRHRTPVRRGRRAGAEHDLVRVEARRPHLMPGEHVGRRRAGEVDGRRGLPARQDLGLRRQAGIWVSDGCSGEFVAGAGAPNETDQAEGPVQHVPNAGFLLVRRREGADLFPALQLRALSQSAEHRRDLHRLVRRHAHGPAAPGHPAGEVLRAVLGLVPDAEVPLLPVCLVVERVAGRPGAGRGRAAT